jgi:hypothetical protein
MGEPTTSGTGTPVPARNDSSRTGRRGHTERMPGDGKGIGGGDEVTTVGDRPVCTTVGDGAVCTAEHQPDRQGRRTE